MFSRGAAPFMIVALVVASSERTATSGEPVGTSDGPGAGVSGGAFCDPGCAAEGGGWPKGSIGG